jgi:UDP-N-acetyl-D-mannosaminuronate dehydrogenase
LRSLVKAAHETKETTSVDSQSIASYGCVFATEILSVNFSDVMPCLLVEPYYLVQKAEELGYHSQVIPAGRAINDYMPQHVFQLVADALNERQRAVNGSKIAVLGFSYKENVGDSRESLSEVVVAELTKRGAQVHLVDQYVDEQALRAMAIPEATAYDALAAVDRSSS